MMSKRMFVISLIVIGLIINGFSFVVHSSNSQGVFLIEDSDDWNKAGFDDLGIYYTRDSLTEFYMPIALKKEDVSNLQRKDINHTVYNGNQNFNDRLRSIDFEILESDTYYVVVYHMLVYASNKSFHIDFVPKIKGEELPQFAWWDSDWGYSKKITIDYTKVAGDETNFPVLIQNTSDDFKNHARSDGYDFRFVDSTNTTEYNIELVDYDNTIGTINELWCNVTSLSGSSDTVLWLYYGNADADIDPSSTSTWDANFKAVYHQKYDASGLIDSTSNGNDGTASGTPNSITGKINGGINYVPNEYYDIGTPYASDPSGFAWEVWINPDTVTSDDGVIGASEPPTAPCFGIYASIWYLVFNVGGVIYVEDTQTLVIDAWHQIVIAYTDDDDTLRYYYDGSEVTTDATEGGTVDMNMELSIARYASGTTHTFDGQLDETRLSDITRSANWISTTYNTQNAPSTFATYGSEQEAPLPPSLIILNPYPENNAVDICPCSDYTSIDIGTDGINNMNLSFYHSVGIDDWFGISSTEYDSSCGDTNGHTCAKALDGVDFWQHEVPATHWFILDLTQTYTIEKVRGRSNTNFDPIEVHIYVSDSKVDWGNAVFYGNPEWQNTISWVEIDTIDKDGRYIKVEIRYTEEGNYLIFGNDSAPYMTIFDVCVSVPSDFHIMEKYYNIPSGTYSFCMCGHSFVPAYIFQYTDDSYTVASAGVWHNIMFINESDNIKNINHTWYNSNNDTFNILYDGIYRLAYRMSFEDTAVAPTSESYGRIIVNGIEVAGTLQMKGMFNKNEISSVSSHITTQLYAGDKVKLQFTGDSTTIKLSSHTLYGDIPNSAILNINRIDDADQHPMHYNKTYYWYVNLSEYGNPSNYNVSSIYKFTTMEKASDCEVLSESKADELFLSSALSFEPSSMLFILWLFLIVIGEWKRDMLYKTLQIPLGVFYGVTLLGSEMWLGLIMICVAIYIGATALWTYRKE